MAESEQVIRLSGEEDIHAVRTMLSRAQAKRLLLVVPNGHAAFERLVRMKMLARHAHDEGMQVALVTTDGRIRDLADQMELSTFRSVEAGRRARRWRSGAVEVAPVAGNGRNGTADTLAWERGRQAVLERRRQIGAHSNWGENVMFAGLVFGMMIVLAAVLLLLVPSASITLVPRQIPLELTFPVQVDASAQQVDFGDALVPGQVLRRDVQGNTETATSGRRDVPSARAAGPVLFINVTGQAVTVPAGTVVSTSSGTSLRFQTTETVSLAAELDARATARVEAINPGPSGNVGALQINIVEGAAAAAVRVLNEAALEGGDVQQAAVVTAADKEQLREQVRQRLLQEGRAALESELGPDQFLIPESITLEVAAETFDGSVDEQRDVLALDMRARVSALVASRADLTRLATRALRAEVPANYVMIEDTFNVVPGETQLSADSPPILAVRAEALAGATLSSGEVSSLVRGQPIEEARAALLQRLPLAADPAIVVTPDWWDRLPYLPLRIFVRVGVLTPEQDETVPPGSENGRLEINGVPISNLQSLIPK